MSDMKKKNSKGLARGLGRGFESLIPLDLLDENFDPTAKQDEQVSELKYIELSKISPDPDQPRRTFDEDALQTLADSIQHHGILQPLVVVVKGEGYQIVAGERRFRAASRIGLDKVPVLVRTLTHQHQLELSLIENLQRKDLNAIETATAYAKLRTQFNVSLEEIGKRVGGKSPSAISNTLRLLRLPKNAQQAIAEGKLTEGQARPLIGQESSLIEKILPRIIRESWSARRVEQFIADSKEGEVTSRGVILSNISLKNEGDRWKKRLNTDVSIRKNSKGSGQVVIKFKDADELERLEKLIGA